MANLLNAAIQQDDNQVPANFEPTPISPLIAAQVSRSGCCTDPAKWYLHNRRTRESTMLTTSQRGSRAALLEMMAEEEKDYKKKKYLLAPTPLQIGRML